MTQHGMSNAPSFQSLSSSFPPPFYLFISSLLSLLPLSFPFRPLLTPLLLFWFLFSRSVSVLACNTHSYAQIHLHSQANTWNGTCHYQSRPAGSFIITLFVVCVCCAHILLYTCMSFYWFSTDIFHTKAHWVILFFSLSNAHMSNTTLHKTTAPVLNRARNSFGFDLESA